MVDYKKSTGNSGTMMIRDNGSTVSFMINSNNSTTFNNQLPWGYTVNGSTNNSRESRYSAGAGWVTLGSWTVSSDQTVTFRLFDTGTSGFGGPTTHSVAINRSSAPNPPSACSLTVLNSTTIRVTFNDGSNNGAAIDSRVIGYGRNSVGPEFQTVSDRSTDVGALSPGTVWYFWARTHNAKGWSGWGPRTSIATWNIPAAPSPVILSNPTQSTVLLSFTDNGNGGTPITARQVRYSTVNNVESSSFVDYSGVMELTNLQPATTYYFWARVLNAAGWSGYSAATSIRTIAGVRININNVWKEAVPYVRTGGVWRVARPWVRNAGVWKETT